MEILDDYLQESDFMAIRERLMGFDFPWYFNAGVDYLPGRSGHDPGNLDDYQFTHLFYSGLGEGSDPNSVVRSHEMPILLPLIRRLGVKRLVRVKANLNPRTERPVPYSFHRDTSQRCKTAVFYVNSNNGSTVFEDGGEVRSADNRIVIFDSDARHTGTTCSDQKVRIVVNINFHPR